MARLDQQRHDYLHGTLLVETAPDTGCTHVFYLPSRQKLEQSDISPELASSYRVKLLELYTDTGTLTIFPTNTLGGHDDFLKPKYNKIRRITLADAKPVLSRLDTELWPTHKFSESLSFGPTKPLEENVEETDIATFFQSEDEIMEILESLPSGFTKDYDYGLGLAKEYEFILTAVEELTDCQEIFISRDRKTIADEESGIFYIATDDFHAMRKSLNSRTNLSRAAARSVKKTETYNFLAEKIGQKNIPLELGRHPIRKLLTRAIEDNPEYLSNEDQDEVLGVFSKSVRSIAESKPERLAKLRGDIELVNLEVLIDRYEAMMRERHKEADWQEFLNENPFILGLAFGYPIIVVQEQASVGGRKLSARGEKLADFLVKNSMTDNTALIEIKTPHSKLLNKTQFRDGVLTPSSELSGSINQVLDQRYQFQREIALIKDKSKIFDISSYSVHCCLIIGTMPDEADEHKSLELFRGNSKDVQIITFDELLQKLKNLQELLATSGSQDASSS